MHPEICTIGPFTVYSYGLMLALAFFVCASLAAKQAKKEGLNPEKVFNLAFIAFISGIIGARVFYVIENLEFYIKHPLDVIMLQRGGLSWFGGLILGSISGVAYLKSRGVSVYKMLDLISPYVALAQAIGRIGCLLNGCCFGKASESGIYFAVHEAVLVPVQLYSSLVLIVIFIILRLFQERSHSSGSIFFAYLLLYSVKRFVIEFWRADSQIFAFGLTLFQIISVALFCLSAVKLALILKSKP